MIIGLTGAQTVGKTTVMNVLIEKFNAVPLSIAAQIKAHTHALVGVNFPETEKDKPQEILGGKAPRDLYIHIGNLDEYFHDLWVDKMFRAGYQGPDALHVIESVGKQFQWDRVKEFARIQRDECCILNITRAGIEYNDNRHPIVDPEARTYEFDNNGPQRTIFAAVWPVMQHIRDDSLELRKKL